jgi:hypothetical protein
VLQRLDRIGGGFLLLLILLSSTRSEDFVPFLSIIVLFRVNLNGEGLVVRLKKRNGQRKDDYLWPRPALTGKYSRDWRKAVRKGSESNIMKKPTHQDLGELEHDHERQQDQKVALPEVGGTQPVPSRDVRFARN